MNKTGLFVTIIEELLLSHENANMDAKFLSRFLGLRISLDVDSAFDAEDGKHRFRPLLANICIDAFVLGCSVA